MIDRGKLLEKLVDVYGPEQARQLDQRIADSVSRYGDGLAVGNGLDQSDVMLITYGDQVREPSVAPLASFRKFADKYPHSSVLSIHVR